MWSLGLLHHYLLSTTTHLPCYYVLSKNAKLYTSLHHIIAGWFGHWTGSFGGGGCAWMTAPPHLRCLIKGVGGVVLLNCMPGWGYLASSYFQVARGHIRVWNLLVPQHVTPRCVLERCAGLAYWEAGVVSWPSNLMHKFFLYGLCVCVCV